MNIVYFDNAATTKIRSEVLNEMIPYLTSNYGNASSLYSIGRTSKHAIDNARAQVASLINCNPNEIYFTSCGSESDNTALKGIAFANKKKGNHIITSKIEHPAILESCKFLEKQGFDISYINVGSDGFINLQELENAIRPTTILISIMFANNEIGTIQPIEDIAKIAHNHNIIFHTDAVQAIGNCFIDVQKMNIDMLSLSGHKIHAPKGIGALYVKNGIEFENFINGGHQEKNKRAGTENVAEIVGLGKACEIARINLSSHVTYLSRLRNYLIDILKIDLELMVLFKIDYLGNANVSFVGADASKLIFELDNMGICVSSGSACSSGNTTPSHVLSAINTPKLYINSAIRSTFSDFNTFEEIDYFINALKLLLK